MLRNEKSRDHLLGRVVGAQPVLQLPVIDRHLDRDARVDQPDERRRDPDVGGAAAVGGAGEPSHVGRQPPADDEHGLPAQQPEVAEGVGDPRKRRQGLLGLGDRDPDGGQLDLVVGEVRLHLLAVQVMDRVVDDHQTAADVAVAVGELGVVGGEGALDVEQVEGDRLVTSHMEGGRRRLERRVKGAHAGISFSSWRIARRSRRVRPPVG